MEIVRVTTVNEWEPVPLETLKNDYCRQDSSDDNARILSLGAIATEVVEDLTLVSASPVQFKLKVDSFYEIVLPRGPLISVDNVKYYDENNALQTLSNSNYEVVIGSRLGTLRFLDVSLPTVYGDKALPVEITFTAGFTSPELTPGWLKIAVGMLTASYYDNPSGVSAVLKGSIPFGVEKLCALNSLRGL